MHRYIGASETCATSVGDFPLATRVGIDYTRETLSPLAKEGSIIEQNSGLSSNFSIFAAFLCKKASRRYLHNDVRARSFLYRHMQIQTPFNG